MDNNVTNKKTILSGVQSSGILTLGNYLGALKNWTKLQDEYNCLYCVADLHSITVRQNPADLRRNAMNVFTTYLAAGIDPEKSIMFFQSHVSAHPELSWVLNCYTYMGELQRMTQFKDKAAKHEDNINSGLFTYPVLMAADILLYQADLVPVGHDQLQHLEITRDIAKRFNGVYGDVFKIPEAYIGKVGARIMSLATPESKMSKSDPNPNGYIAMLDDRDTIVRKFKRAVTDSDGEIAYREGKDGINNLLSIYSAVTGKTIDESVAEFSGMGYGDFKMAVAEVVADCLKPIQDRYNALQNDKAYIQSVYRDGAEKASKIAYKTLRKVYKKVGFTER